MEPQLRCQIIMTPGHHSSPRNLQKVQQRFSSPNSLQKVQQRIPVQTTFKSFEKEVIKTGEYFEDTSEKTYKFEGATVVKARKASVATIGDKH